VASVSLGHGLRDLLSTAAVQSLLSAVDGLPRQDRLAPADADHMVNVSSVDVLAVLSAIVAAPYALQKAAPASVVAADRAREHATSGAGRTDEVLREVKGSAGHALNWSGKGRTHVRQLAALDRALTDETVDAHWVEFKRTTWRKIRGKHLCDDLSIMEPDEDDYDWGVSAEEAEAAPVLLQKPEKKPVAPKMAVVKIEDDGSVAETHLGSLAPTVRTSLRSSLPGNYKLLYSKLLEVGTMLAGKYLSIDQMIELWHIFPDCELIRVELLLACFGTLIDLKHVHRLLGLLTPEEQVECRHRIGVLNLFNPTYPDYFFRFDMSHYEDREAAKILIVLAMAEPGENWTGERFRRNKNVPWSPGWVLPLEWSVPDSPRGQSGAWRQGLLELVYTSTGRGCAPEWDVREGLRERCLVGTALRY